jgi:hypothetical protein
MWNMKRSKSNIDSCSNSLALSHRDPLLSAVWSNLWSFRSKVPQLIRGMIVAGHPDAFPAPSGQEVNFRDASTLSAFSSSALCQSGNIGRPIFGRNSLKWRSIGGATSSRMMSLITQFTTRRGQTHTVLQMQEWRLFKLDKVISSKDRANYFHTQNSLWRGSRNGFDARDIHSRCGEHPNTSTLILDTKENVFGGFTQMKWEYYRYYKGDLSVRNFLFTLTNPHNLRGLGAGHVNPNATSGSPTCVELDIARDWQCPAGKPTPKFR